MEHYTLFRRTEGLKMVFTDAGANEIRDWLASTAGAAAPSYMAVGNDNTAETKADTVLVSELIRGAIDIITPSDKSVEFEWTLLSTQENGEDIKEFGLFNAAASGDMFTRSTHTAVAKNSSIEIKYRLKLRVKN